jgi:hypothetical protein
VNRSLTRTTRRSRHRRRRGRSRVAAARHREVRERDRLEVLPVDQVEEAAAAGRPRCLPLAHAHETAQPNRDRSHTARSLPISFNPPCDVRSRWTLLQSTRLAVPGVLRVAAGIQVRPAAAKQCERDATSRRACRAMHFVQREDPARTLPARAHLRVDALGFPRRQRQQCRATFLCAWVGTSVPARRAGGYPPP